MRTHVLDRRSGPHGLRYFTFVAIMIAVPGAGAMSQEHGFALAASDPDVTYVHNDAALLVGSADPGDKAILAAMLIASASVLQLESYINNPDSPTSLKWLASWQRVKIGAMAKLIEDDIDKTRLPQDLAVQFFGILEEGGNSVPDGWRHLLQTGSYLKNDYFYPFEAGQVPAGASELHLVSMTGNEATVTDGRNSWSFVVTDELSDFDVTGGIVVDGDAIILLEAKDEAWSYRIIRVGPRATRWTAELETYWVFPTGANSSVELVKGRDGVRAYCSTPSSLAINRFDFETGRLTAVFSTKVADLGRLRIQSTWDEP